MRGRIFLGLSVVTGALLVACPIRNLLYLRECLGAVGVRMDVPAAEARLETDLLLLQSCLALLGAFAMWLGSRRRPWRIAAGIAWFLVVVGGFVWDKVLGQFAGAESQPDSAYACLLDHRSAHTHSALTNGPILGAAVLAVWVLWDVWSHRDTSELRSS